MKAMRILLSGALLLAGVLGAAAAVDFSLQIGDVVWIGGGSGYDCFSSTAYPNTVNFTITKTKAGDAPYAVTADTSQNTGTYTRKLKSGANLLNYQLFTTSLMNYQWKAPTTATANEVISGISTGPKNEVIPLSYIFYIAPGQVVPPGIYIDHVTVKIFPAYNSTGGAYATQNVKLTATVAATAAISIVPTGSSFNSGSPNLTLDFGTLSPAQTRNCDILIKQNNNCTVYFSSANNGVLKKIPTPGSDQIPYTASAAGIALNLTQSGNTVLSSGISPGPDGNRFPVTVTIGSFGFVGAATYQDQITLTVVAQ